MGVIKLLDEQVSQLIAAKSILPLHARRITF